MVIPPRRGHPPHRHRRRGSALTELAICLLPYSLLFIGSLIFWQLGMGMQESAKAVAWYASDPRALTAEDVRMRFFIRDLGQVDIPGKRFDVLSNPAEDAEEPVLPYGNSVGGIMDLEAAIARGLAYSASIDGTLRAFDSRGLARALREMGVVSGESYAAATGRGAEIDFDQPEQIDLPGLELTDEGRAALQAAAAALGDGQSGPANLRWLTYHWGGIDSYRGGAPFLPFGKTPQPMETEGEAAADFRRGTVLRGGTLGASPDAGLAWMEAVVRNDGAVRGRHRPGELPDVPFVEWIGHYLQDSLVSPASPDGAADQELLRYGDKARALVLSLDSESAAAP